MEAGDLVWSRDERTGEEGWRRVVETFVTPDQPLLEVVLDDGETLEVTPEHPFWSVDDDGWKAAGELEPGQHVETLNGAVSVVRVLASEDLATVYNFEVDGTHTYFVGDSGVWVHNACAAKGGAYWRVRAANVGGEVHHVVSASALRKSGVSVSRGQGPSIWMTKADHKLTASHASQGRLGAAYRAREEALIRQGRADEAIQMGIDDIRAKFPDGRYEDAIQQMIRYLNE